ncbi:DNA translocase FtsK [Candidatus Woesebacteria bacterium]|nr:DNA translocase FtsK [Candidatus Woesebacteria bacterium]
MPRTSKFFTLKLPFVKKVQIQKHTFLNILGLLVAGFAVISYVSYIKTGTVLILINDMLVYWFGIMSILFPTFLLLISTHFFNSKKLKIIKPHVTVGMLLISIAMIGVFRSGVIGRTISENLVADFSGVGAFFILLIAFLVGIILFFNTSVDVFLVIVLNVGKKVFESLYAFVTKFIFNPEAAESKTTATKGEFITNNPPVQPIINVAKQPMPVKGADSPMTIKTISSEALQHWEFPTLNLLEEMKEQKADAGDVARNSDTIERTLDSFGIKARVAEINQGPTVTQYALEIVMGTKLTKITGLANDLALALAAPTGQVRIEAPIPGKSFVGVEIPNRRSETVSLKRMLTSESMMHDPHPLVVPLGLDVSGHPISGNIAKLPHVLIAGTTGSGKSVILNAWICSLLFRATPEDVRLILVDPKRVELTQYNGIPHLYTEVIVEPEKIISALKWTVGEMETRYKEFARVGARNIESYNSRTDIQKVPYIVFIIDELADLMIFAPREAEENITRIAQMARATGIHLILATQRPSVDVITGLMKANIPSRIAFNVPSMIDSRVVLDMPGAEKLVGRGDMLYLPSDQAKPKRIQGPYLSEKDISNIVDFLKQKTPVVHYTEEVTEQAVNTSSAYSGGRGNTSSDGQDQFFNQALDIVYQDGKASASLIQRRLSVGYARAARIIDQLEAAGIIGPAQGSKPRELISRTPSSTPQSEESLSLEEDLHM